MRGSRGGVGGVRTPLEFAKLNIADITGNEKNSYFSYVYVKQNQSCLRLDPPLEKISGSAPGYNGKKIARKSSHYVYVS